MKKRYTYPRYLIGFAVAVAAMVIIFVLGVGNVLGWHRAEATILSKDNNNLTVEYVALDGTTYTNVPMVYSFGGKVGSHILIRYKEDDPTHVDTVAVNIVMGAAVALAAVMLLALGLFFWKTETKEQRNKEAALAQGHPVECKILSTIPEPTIRPGRQSAYVRLDCVPLDLENADPENIVIYTSERFVNPKRALAGKVTVIVNDEDPNKYYVDLDTLVLEDAQEEPSDSI